MEFLVKTKSRLEQINLNRKKYKIPCLKKPLVVRGVDVYKTSSSFFGTTLSVIKKTKEFLRYHF